MAIGGGTGLPVVLSGLSATLDGLTDRPDSLTAIVTVMDDGGSSGQLRRGLGIIPPGDIRNCLAALAANDLPLASVLQHRFGEDSILGGHPVGNILLAALLERTGSVESAVAELSRMLRLRGRVIPCSAADVHLRAVLRDGRTIIGETAIVDARQPIERLEIVPQAQPIPDAIRALVNASVVVLGPGSLYTSVICNLLVTGIGATLSGLTATRIYVANLMTQPGETDGYTVEDHLDAILRHVPGKPLDYVLVNTTSIPADVAEHYHQEG
ncbi:MAG TPA: gluconeogenesis factor YvcK family protein, partial [Vicinamibacterales bacterium]|nr:gluconeogenesis factor YvcK family protein [Vicinamibacterales bacterium]